MRRHLAVLALCLLALSAGCLATVEEDPEDVAADGESGSPFDDASAEGSLSVHAIDVGQADATLVVGPEDETVLIDTGGWQDDGATVLEYLDAAGVDRIDVLVSTHAHADHVGGAAAVIEHYETEAEGVGAIYDSAVASTSQTYERYLDAVEEHDVPFYRTQAGDEIPLEGAHVGVLNPPAERETDDLHDNAVAVHVRHGRTAFLFTGDAETAVEERLVERNGDALESTGYQAGHHGSRTSSSAAFLDAVDPEFALISAAYDSQYGHPHEETLQRFAERSVDVYWTGVHGTIVARSDGETVTVATAVAATTDPASIANASAAHAAATAPVETRATYEGTVENRSTAAPTPSAVDAAAPSTGIAPRWPAAVALAGGERS